MFFYKNNEVTVSFYRTSYHLHRFDYRNILMYNFTYVFIEHVYKSKFVSVLQNMSGVVTFVTAADIPGKNSFIVSAGMHPDPVSLINGIL